MPSVVFHPEAEAEYAEALRWYSKRSLQAADRFESEVENVLDRIGVDPNVFPRYDDMRRFAVVHRFPYSDVYELADGALHIIAVAHTSRSPGYWRSRH